MPQSLCYILHKVSDTETPACRKTGVQHDKILLIYSKILYKTGLLGVASFSNGAI